MKTAVIIFSVLFVLSFATLYAAKRIDYPGEYKRPLSLAALPALVLSGVVTALIVGALALAN